MRRLIVALGAVAVVAAVLTGCAAGPLFEYFRGGRIVTPSPATTTAAPSFHAPSSFTDLGDGVAYERLKRDDPLFDCPNSGAYAICATFIVFATRDCEETIRIKATVLNRQQIVLSYAEAALGPLKGNRTGLIRLTTPEPNGTYMEVIEAKCD